MRWLALWMIAGVISSVAFAEDDYRAIALDAQKAAHEKTLLYRDDAELALRSQHKVSELTPHKSMPSILIFVSFSMPEKSLEAYLRDAKKIHASVVIRGLMDNSFQKTMQRVARLVNASDGSGIELNPLWFKRFSITKVPAVVIVPGASPCFKDKTCQKEKDYDVMTGDITLAAALKIIRDKGIVAQDIAQTALNHLQDIAHD
jgi:conjugal transfer pilus assembly protein TrbC